MKRWMYQNEHKAESGADVDDLGDQGGPWDLLGGHEDRLGQLADQQRFPGEDLLAQVDHRPDAARQALVDGDEQAERAEVLLAGQIPRMVICEAIADDP